MLLEETDDRSAAQTAGPTGRFAGRIVAFAVKSTAYFGILTLMVPYLSTDLHQPER